jgi:hypothetical protein
MMIPTPTEKGIKHECEPRLFKESSRQSETKYLTGNRPRGTSPDETIKQRVSLPNYQQHLQQENLDSF